MKPTGAELRVVEEKQEPTFDDFWTLMTRKVAKYETRIEWNRLSPAEKLEAVVGAAKWRSVWLDMEQKYVLHPDRFLRRHRWEDELPTDFVRLVSAAHVQAVLPTAERGEMPEAVRALIAKLRGAK